MHDITQMTTPDQEIKLYKIRFHDDEDQEIICNFEDGKIHKCKAELKKANLNKQEEAK
jgi:major membrane immunogen (membrane-anchored lipoprotein)